MLADLIRTYEHLSSWQVFLNYILVLIFNEVLLQPEAKKDLALAKREETEASRGERSVVPQR